MLLADYVIRRLRAQLLGQRGIAVYRILGKQIAQGNTLSGQQAIKLNKRRVYRQTPPPENHILSSGDTTP
jgi:hypothetical protein